MATLLQEIAEQFHRDGAFMRVTIIDAQGSTPRGKGAAMMVSGQGVTGTIGGGALEYDAIAHAGALLQKNADQAWQRDAKDYPLGPRLGQCCGGHVRLLFERYGAEEAKHFVEEIDAETRYLVRPLSTGAAPIGISCSKDAKATPEIMRKRFQFLDEEDNADINSELVKASAGEWFLEPVKKKPLPIYLYGAGHVGREVVRIFAGMAVEIVWIDTDASRFPDPMPGHVRRLIAAAPHEAVAYAPNDAFHIVMSYSHALDLEICHAVLKRGKFRYLGLIGSTTKRARFLKRLQELNVAEADLVRLICPIGTGGPTSKEPAVIAIALAAEILRLAAAPQNDEKNDQETDCNRAEQ